MVRLSGRAGTAFWGRDFGLNITSHSEDKGITSFLDLVPDFLTGSTIPPSAGSRPFSIPPSFSADPTLFRLRFDRV
jgi:hypothetical protein